jgi:cytochrome b pre-mRNA-processing protein 3
MILRWLLGNRENKGQAIYEKLVKSARNERFYSDFGVPDTVDGRFDMVVLHTFLYLERLGLEGSDHEQLKQEVTDAFFKDMDRSLREMGVGDLSVGKKVRKMAEAFFGRVNAYKTAQEVEAMQAALERNVFAGALSSKVGELAKWVIEARQQLAAQATDSVLDGQVQWP